MVDRGMAEDNARREEAQRATNRFGEEMERIEGDMTIRGGHFSGNDESGAHFAARDLVAERRKTHGDWHQQAATAQALKIIINTRDNGLSPHQREALDMIVVKISRILCGDPSAPDHWQDIAGYARLGERGHE